jgi:hypothetical protein
MVFHHTTSGILAMAANIAGDGMHGFVDERFVAVCGKDGFRGKFSFLKLANHIQPG